MKIVDKSLVSCGDKTIRIWNLTDGTLLHELRLPGLCNNFDLNNERTLLAIAHSKGVSTLDFQNLIQVMDLELNDVNDVRFNMDGTRLIIGQFNGQVSKVSFDFKSGETVPTVPTTQISTIKQLLPTSFR